MAYTFPLTADQFFRILPIREMSFDIPEALETSETGGGEILTAALGTRLWQGEVSLGDMEPDEAAEVLALLDVLRRPGASFMAFDVARPGPRAAPDGVFLVGDTPLLHTVDANTREIRLSGLPAGFPIQRFDYLAFSYGSSPTRFALHRAVSGAVAATTGITPLFEVSPNVRPGYTLTAVSLVRASCKAVIVPGSVNPGKRAARLTKGAGFKFMQTLR